MFRICLRDILYSIIDYARLDILAPMGTERLTFAWNHLDLLRTSQYSIIFLEDPTA